MIKFNTKTLGQGSGLVNKRDLIEKIASDADIAEASAERALSAIINKIIQTVTKDEDVQLFGFGTFKSGKRTARVGRNPKTGDEIQIAAANVPAFVAGKALKESVN